ncbi:hypothetical protein [Paraburkholderia phenazinium]|uniref:Uncharacterized protein n=1 Tax=Paraburkholderia phenazinium TaxID=60549 RepID=A0A1G7S8C1_9BURK|nr:hypothetical protein [Paraburkholderia phenazinium]SDG19231.1 hypothetical protein SAMN05216466_102422 [Paraburkholderia phenazinium]
MHRFCLFCDLSNRFIRCPYVSQGWEHLDTVELGPTPKFIMPRSTYPNIGAQAELLTYLVVSQLIKRYLTGKWLATEHVVESTHLWLHLNGGDFDLLQRVTLASRAQGVAELVMRTSSMSFDAKTLGDAFLDHLHLDYKAPAVVEIYRLCVAQIILGLPSAGSRP